VIKPSAVKRTGSGKETLQKKRGDVCPQNKDAKRERRTITETGGTERKKSVRQRSSSNGANWGKKGGVTPCGRGFEILRKNERKEVLTLNPEEGANREPKTRQQTKQDGRRK